MWTVLQHVLHAEIEKERYVMCLGASVIMMFSMGSARSFGILLLEISSRFQAKQGLSALTLGLIVAGIALFGSVPVLMLLQYCNHIVAA